jgi:hypothetical protein
VFKTIVEAIAGELSPAATRELEDHAFACDECGATYARAMRLAHALRQVLPPVVSARRIEQLRAQGWRISTTDVRIGEHRVVTFFDDVDLLAHVLHGDLTAARRVDVELADLAGNLLVACEAVPFDAERGEVVIACQRHYAASFPAALRFRVFRTTAAGRELVGEYDIDHRW